MQTSTAPLTVGAVAALLGVTVQAVRNRDAELSPSRDVYGRRTYDPARVSEMIARRAERRR